MLYKFHLIKLTLKKKLITKRECRETIQASELMYILYRELLTLVAYIMNVVQHFNLDSSLKKGKCLIITQQTYLRNKIAALYK